MFLSSEIQYIRFNISIERMVDLDPGWSTELTIMIGWSTGWSALKLLTNPVNYDWMVDRVDQTL